MLRTALIIGASSGIGAAYADCLARRGHDLVLVARDVGKMNRSRRGVAIDVLGADPQTGPSLPHAALRPREDVRQELRKQMGVAD